MSIENQNNGDDEIIVGKKNYISLQSGDSLQQRLATPNIQKHHKLTISHDSDSALSSDFGPGFDELPAAQQKIIRDLAKEVNFS